MKLDDDEISVFSKSVEIISSLLYPYSSFSLVNTSIGKRKNCSTSSNNCWWKEKTNICLDQSTQSNQNTPLNGFLFTLNLGWWMGPTKEGFTWSFWVSISLKSHGNGQRSSRSSWSSRLNFIFLYILISFVIY